MKERTASQRSVIANASRGLACEALGALAGAGAGAFLVGPLGAFVGVIVGAALGAQVGQLLRSHPARPGDVGGRIEDDASGDASSFLRRERV